MKYLCIWLIRLYQKFLSPLKRQPTCRFSPTCSSYAIEAYRKRGFFVGTILMVTRVARCQPFGGAGWDPVPEGIAESTLRCCAYDKVLLSGGIRVGGRAAQRRGTMTRSAAPRGKSTSAVRFPNIGREF